MYDTREQAIAAAGIYSLLPWQDEERWEEHVLADLSARPKEWNAHRGEKAKTLGALRALGAVFDEMATVGRLTCATETRFRSVLTHVQPTYQAEGPGAGTGWETPAGSWLFRRVAQLAGNLQHAIRIGAVGFRLRRCPVCGLVFPPRRLPRLGDRGCCCRTCNQTRARKPEAYPAAPLPGPAPSLRLWGQMALDTTPTAMPAETYQRMASARDAKKGE